MFGWRPEIVSFSKSPNEDIWVFLSFFLLLGQGGKKNTPYEPEHFWPFCWSSSVVENIDQDIRKTTRKLERLHLKILKRKLSVVFNRTYLDNDLLPKYTIYIYIYICVCVCMYVCISIYIHTFQFHNSVKLILLTFVINFSWRQISCFTSGLNLHKNCSRFIMFIFLYIKLLCMSVSLFRSGFCIKS